MADDGLEADGEGGGVEVDVRHDLGHQQAGGVGEFVVTVGLEEEGDDVAADLGAGRGVRGPEAIDLRRAGIWTVALVTAAAWVFWVTREWTTYVCLLAWTRGRFSWRLARFLEWAQEAGLLRTSGEAYQFRHREFQEWLARHPDPVVPSAA